VKKPITKKYLTDVLLKYYDGDEKHATELNSFIQDNREAVLKETIRQRRLRRPSLQTINLRNNNNTIHISAFSNNCGVCFPRQYVFRLVNVHKFVDIIHNTIDISRNYV